jgi:hypothetical protein
MFLLYHSEGCNICEMVLCECYVNDLYTTTCSGVLDHHTRVAPESLHQDLHNLEVGYIGFITNACVGA